MTETVRNDVTRPPADGVPPVLVQDPRAARVLAGVEQTRAVTQARIALADADADRRLRIAARRAQLAADQRAARRQEAAEATAARQQRRADAAAARRVQRAALVTRAAGLLRLVRERGVAVYAAVMYLLAVGGAVYGQFSAATGRGWPLLVGVVIAAAVEGLALVMALTAQQLRLQGEAARLPRALTWLCAAFASAVNYAGHADLDRTGAVLLATLSAAGIVVWEVRSGAAHRAELRRRGLLPDPPASFGWRRWCRYFPSTAAAWSLDIRSRVSPRSAALLAQVAAEDQARHIRREAEQVRRLARRAVRRALRRGESGAVLAALTALAAHGTTSTVPALTGGPASRTSPPRRSGVRLPSIAESVARPPRHGSVRRGSPSRRTRIQRRRTARLRRARVQQVRTRHAETASSVPARARGGPKSGPHTAPVQVRDPVASSNGTVRQPQSRKTSTRGPGSGGTVPGTAVRSKPDKAGRLRARPDVSDLLPAGRQIRSRFAAQGLALSRSALIAQLRAAGVPVSTDRASALLLVLTSKSMPAADTDASPG
ncbi:MULTISPECIES: DUF2637 domain-containing protein [Catenuloplanes]|uniref:DUF2637 domain-containing protein n=1 Tax=Catenuloplanes niger TaxID=587534 RepID=A0AAE3ZMS8_9ACTN|nr:DUF2637 domain-containing protein [Catenuloplanes niger]MDR7322642.1 hypothetical protein [Catenuloplanes niger]